MNLFEKVKIKNTEFKNKFFRAATFEGKATTTGHMTDDLFEIYKNLAKGGVGAIITSYAFVVEEEQPNPRMIGIYNDSFIEEYKKLTDMCKFYDTRIILQACYGGSMTNLEPHSKNIFGPSPVKNEVTGVTPIEMTKKDLNYIKDAFINAAIRSEKSGCDGIEIHCAHGYMLSHFLSNDYNLRTDEYGGSIENRARFICEIINGIKKEVSSDFLVFIKINSQDFTKNGLSEDDSISAIKMFEKSGLDAIEISGGNSSSTYVLENDLSCQRKNLTDNRQSYFKEFAIKLKKQTNIPVILTGGNKTLTHLDILNKENKIDFFGLSRTLVCEPDLITKWEKDYNYSAKCVSCCKCFKVENKNCILHN